VGKNAAPDNEIVRRMKLEKKKLAWLKRVKGRI
jgi:hypothetical protein